MRGEHPDGDGSPASAKLQFSAASHRRRHVVNCTHSGETQPCLPSTHTLPAIMRDVVPLDCTAFRLIHPVSVLASSTAKLV